jgi:hypothetical protein
MDKNKIKDFLKTNILDKLKERGINKYAEYKVLNNVPELIPILVDLMSKDFSLFVADIEWVAPKPPTFRVLLENDQYFYLSDLKRSWVAEVEGKKYYLLNLGEEEMAMTAIARILRYGKPVNPQTEADTGGPIPGDEMEASLENPPAGETEETPAGEIPADLL